MALLLALLLAGCHDNRHTVKAVHCYDYEYGVFTTKRARTCCVITTDGCRAQLPGSMEFLLHPGDPLVVSRAGCFR